MGWRKYWNCSGLFYFKLGVEMSGVKETIWEAQPHTIAKHEILRRYLNAWFPIMGRHHGRIIYIDGFAGPGIYENGEPGSPIIALQCALGHRNPLWKEIIFRFIEQRQDRCDKLESLIGGLEGARAFDHRVVPGVFAEAMTPLLDDLQIRGFYQVPTFAFIDPFGWVDVPFSIVARILEYPKSEVLITFMLDELKRFVGEKVLWNNLTVYFGNENWKPAIMLSGADREKHLIETYVENLKTLASAKYVRTFRMINMRHQTDYYLVYATKHIKGLDKMKESMWKVGTVGDFQFADATAYSRQIEFSQPDFAAGVEQIFGEFRGRKVPIEMIERLVIEKTAFYSGNFRTPILGELMEDARACLITGVEGRKRQKSGEYPKGSLITFADKME